MQSQIAKGWGAGCVRWLGGYLLTLVIFVCVSVVAVPLILVTGAYAADHFGSSTATLIALALTVLALLAAAGLALAVGGWVLIQRRRQLDAVFLPLGLAGSALGLSGRQYHGSVQGRRVDVYYVPATGGWQAFGSPAKLDLYVATPLKTSLSVVTRDAVIEAAARLMQHPALQLNGAEWSGCDIFALDPDWSSALLADPAAKPAILRLTTNQGAFEQRQFSLRPEALQLHSRRMPTQLLTSPNAQGWMDDILLIARVAESLPPPVKTEVVSSLERAARTDRNRQTLLGYGIGLGVALAVIVCVTLSFWLVDHIH